ncbi:hypothetical protein [Clostridium tagluense]|uniref:Uncharacterized protein n=1 Tax=Clostridium tagluense TaxID=360422 RepID=A0A401UM56_9CLOT|nr:hypothetical protein [Clostridium tagluense]GCD10604.1 hypothetical protein Ctaglu_22270 [Clostridium tagluense]
MIFLGNLTKITDIKYKIGFIHYMPFDVVNGMNKTQEELEKDGILVDDIPEAKQVDNKNPIMYVNPKNKEIFYEYIYISKTQEQGIENNIQDRMKALEQSNAEMMAMIATMATPTV